MTPTDPFHDLLDRCEVGAKALAGMAGRALTDRERTRFLGKADGMRLAASYIEDARRIALETERAP